MRRNKRARKSMTNVVLTPAAYTTDAMDYGEEMDYGGRYV